MKRLNHALVFSLILTVCLAGTAFACNKCSSKSAVNYQKDLTKKGKAVKVYGSLFFSEEQLLFAEDPTAEHSEPQQALDDSVNILPALYYILSDRIVIKAVYNKFILPVSPEEIRAPQPRPSDSVTVGLDFKF